MLLTLKKKNEDGTFDLEATASENELNFLINFALDSLIQIGAVAVDQSKFNEEQKVELPILSNILPPEEIN